MLTWLKIPLAGQLLLGLRHGPHASTVLRGSPALLKPGMTLQEIRRHGKVALFDFGAALIAVQLGMSGRLVLRPAHSVHDHLTLCFQSGHFLTFTDHRRFGRIHILPVDGAWNQPPLEGLGPDALFGNLQAVRLRKGRRPIKTVLLDQSVFAGLGNIYACESLYRAGIDPRRPCVSLTDAEAGRLAAVIPALLREAVAAGGTTLEDYRGTEGEAGSYGQQLAVYGRDGQPCVASRCADRVQRIWQHGRSTWYCPGCQR